MNCFVTVWAKKNQICKTDGMTRGVSGYWNFVMGFDIFDSVLNKEIFAAYIANPSFNVFQSPHSFLASFGFEVCDISPLAFLE